MKSRPFGVTVLAILAGIAGVLAAIHALQSLGILPFLIGSFQVRAFSVSFILNAIILIYCMLPGGKRAFEVV